MHWTYSLPIELASSSTIGHFDNWKMMNSEGRFNKGHNGYLVTCLLLISGIEEENKTKLRKVCQICNFYTIPYKGPDGKEGAKPVTKSRIERFEYITNLWMGIVQYRAAEVVTGLFQESISDGIFKESKDAIILNYFREDFNLALVKTLVRRAHKSRDLEE